MTGIHRRHTLYLAGIGMTALAGCSESSSDEPGETDTEPDESDDEGPTSDESEDGAEEATEYEGTIEIGDLPSYASVLPEIDRSEYFYGAVDFETIETIVDDEGDQTGEEPTDPLVVNPLDFVLMCYRRVNHISDSAPAEAELVYANGIYAIVDEYDPESVGTDLENAGYEVLEDDDFYTIYTGEGSTDLVGISSEVFAFPGPNSNESATDPADMVRQLLRTAVGQRDPKHAVDDEFERLLRMGSDSGIATGIYTDADEFDAAWLGADGSTEGTDVFDSDYSAFEGADGAHQHLVLSDDERARAGAVVTYADEDRVDVNRLESSLGTEADTVELTRDETAVSVDAEYSGDL